MVVKVFVYWIRGEQLPIDLCENEEQLKTITVRQLREKIERHLDISDYKLVYVDQKLDDSRFLYEYGIRHESVIFIVLDLPGEGSGPRPPKGDGGMGDKDDMHRQSMERLAAM